MRSSAARRVFTDSRLAGDEHQAAPALGHEVFQGGLQGGRLPFAADEHAECTRNECWSVRPGRWLAHGAILTRMTDGFHQTTCPRQRVAY